MVRTSQLSMPLYDWDDCALFLLSLTILLAATMHDQPDRKQQRVGKRPRSPPTQPDLPFPLEKLETLKAAMDQYHQEALKAVQPLLGEEVAVRKRAWQENWTGNLAGVVVSSAQIIELEAAKSKRRINSHEQDFLRILRGVRKSDYARAREDIVQTTVKEFKQAAILEILQTRCNQPSVTSISRPSSSPAH